MPYGAREMRALHRPPPLKEKARFGGDEDMAEVMGKPKSSADQWLAARGVITFLRGRFTNARGVWVDGEAQLASKKLEDALGFCPECGTCGSDWGDGQKDTGHECSRCGSPGQ